MRNAVVLALALLVGTCAACGTSPPPRPVRSPVALASELERRSVALVKTGSALNSIYAYCTGVWVAPDAWLTANHCVALLDVRDTVTYAVSTDVSEDEVRGVRAGTLAARDAAHDLALVRDLGAPGHGAAKVSFPVVGQNAFSMGHPLGLWWSFTGGQVSAMRLKAFDEEDAMWWVQATTPVSPGNSGGGLFDEDGNVMGICHGFLPMGEQINYFVHPKYIKAFLEAQGIQ